MKERLSVALVWHMHQPEYREPTTGTAAMPWVRLHAAKDYLDMAALAEEFPAARQTFNLTPVLLEQAIALAEGGSDEQAILCSKPVAEFTPNDRIRALNSCFMVNWDHRVMAHPRYRELAEKRGRNPGPGEIEEAAARFTDQDFIDLSVLFGLAWTGSREAERNPEFRELASRGEGYTEEDRAHLLAVHRRLLAEIVPYYRKLHETGLIEVTTTPYYHPISPLLISQECARESRPDMRIPSRRFDGRRDAEWQMDSAIALHERLFGVKPAGMWPAEGGVSSAFATLAASRGIKWIATDEAVLYESLARTGESIEGIPHGEPWLVGEPGSQVAMLFRDRQLSDSIGFKYSRWNPTDAVNDFIRRLKMLAEYRATGSGPALIPVILDGENAWESYHNEGKDFLRSLYSALSTDPEIECVTPSAWLARHEPQRRLRKLVAGSWINRDFGVWIGHQEDHKAWQLVAEAREALLAAEPALKPERFNLAWRHLMIAEGSDWCWWFGDEHFTPLSGEFDRLFRANLSEVYRSMGKEPPLELLQAIKQRTGAAAVSPQTGWINPIEVDGIPSSYFEWLNAASYDVTLASAEMHRGWNAVRRIYFGIDRQGILSLRIDHNDEHGPDAPEDTQYTVRFLEPVSYDIPLIKGESLKKVSFALGQGQEIAIEYAWKSIIEARIAISAGSGVLNRIKFMVIAMEAGASGRVIEQWPVGDVFVLDPGKLDFVNDWNA